MRKIVLYEHGSSSNHGCEAIVRSTCALLNITNKQGVLYSNDPDADKKYDLNRIIEVKSIYQGTIASLFASAIRRLSFGKIDIHYGWMDNVYLKRKRKLMLSIGGDNYCYKGLIPSLIERHRLARLSGSPTVLWGASFKKELFTDELIEDLKSYDLITVRESTSANMLEEVGLTNYIETFDTAFLLKPEKTGWPDGNYHRDVVGINLSPLIYAYAEKEVVVGAFVETIKYIISNTSMEVALIPHVVLEGTDDREALKEIKSHFQNTDRVFLLENDYNCCELKSLISQCRFFIGSRTHATIAAYSSNVPTVVLGYSSKSVGIARDLFGTAENYVVDCTDIRDASTLINSLEYLRKNESSIKEHLKTIIPTHLEKLYEAARKVKQLYN